jgi:hypothetical protein
MKSFLTLLLVMAADDPADGIARKMLPIYLKEAQGYSIAVASAPKTPLELKSEPVFEWSNPTRNGGQQGVVFLWCRDGRPAAVGCLFSSPDQGFASARRVEHEFHALDSERLVVERDAFNRWEPKAGLTRQVLDDAGVPGDTPNQRKLQMGRIAGRFAGYTIDAGTKRRYDLRLLPTPLYRYPAAKTGVIDGALFAIASEAGTDPEVFLLIEAREANGTLRWDYALCRFSDCEIHVSLKGQGGTEGKEVFSSIPSETDPYPHNKNHTYRTYQDKIMSLDGKLLAHVRQDAKGSHVVPVEK